MKGFLSTNQFFDRLDKSNTFSENIFVPNFAEKHGKISIFEQNDKNHKNHKNVKINSLKQFIGYLIVLTLA
jgi:hypothetical protein